MRAGQRACLLAHARRLPLKVLAPLPREVRVVIAHEHVAGAPGGGGRRQRARRRRRDVPVAPLLLLLEPLPHVEQRGVGRERVPQRPVLGAQGERARVARGGGGRLDCVRHGVRRAGLPGRRLSHRERGGGGPRCACALAQRERRGGAARACSRCGLRLLRNGFVVGEALGPLLLVLLELGLDARALLYVLPLPSLELLHILGEGGGGRAS